LYLKYVQQGFIKLTAREVANGIQIAVEDSGSGIPVDKRETLFHRFQESLDRLNQGTGMGLSLCQGIVSLMEGQLYLDTEYDSGIEGFPGSRFIVELAVRPLSDHPLGIPEPSTALPSGSFVHDVAEVTLPATLRVLLVDDDTVLRKMLNRSIKRMAPGWKIREAANGETALSIVESEGLEAFDLILMDHYMASVEKSLLGTYTIHALRARGVTCRICGLSANDMNDAFRAAGADDFLFKPLATERSKLECDFRKVLGLRQDI
jgi:CheY-like chemotaxis protein